MSELVRYAILDTDFVSKANIIKTTDRVLADEVLAFPGYRFFYHKKMENELDDHGTNEAKLWLKEKTENGIIFRYDDDQIISELKAKLGESCFAYYQSFLKDGCDMIDADFYGSYFAELDDWIESKGFDEEGFLKVLNSCEDKIGHQKSYGEIKAFVLLKFINMMYGTEAFIFCSDDRNARQGFANTAQIPCISILSVFVKLWLMEKPYEEIQQYYQSFVDWCLNREDPQTTVKVWIFKTGSYKREGVCIENVLADIYAGKYEARKDGDLRLKIQ